MIFLVIVLHSSIPYTAVVPLVVQWYVPIAHSVVFDWIVFSLDIFIMPVMFFIAGYFAYGSWRKRPLPIYIRDKLVHILIPFILGSLLLNAYPNYIGAVVHEGLQGGYLHYFFTTYLVDIFYMFNHSKASVHLWFLGILFLFYIVYIIIHPIVNRLHLKRQWTIFGLAFISAALFALVNYFSLDYQTWRTYALAFTVQQTRFPIYFLYFFFGIVMYRNQEHFHFKFLGFWFVYTLILGLADVGFVIKFLPEILENHSLKIVHALLHCFASVGYLVTLLLVFERWFNKPSKIFQNIASNSYAIYFIHFNIMIFSEYHLRYVDISIYLKWLITIVSSAVLSYLISELILKRLPWIRKMLY